MRNQKGELIQNEDGFETRGLVINGTERVSGASMPDTSLVAITFDPAIFQGPGSAGGGSASGGAANLPVPVNLFIRSTAQDITISRSGTGVTVIPAGTEYFRLPVSPNEAFQMSIAVAAVIEYIITFVAT